MIRAATVQSVASSRQIVCPRTVVDRPALRLSDRLSGGAFLPSTAARLLLRTREAGLGLSASVQSAAKHRNRQAFCIKRPPNELN